MKIERKPGELILRDTPFFMRVFIAIFTVVIAVIGLWCLNQALSDTNHQKSTEILFASLFALFLAFIGTGIFFSLPKITFRLNSLKRKSVLEEFSLLYGRNKSEYDFDQILFFRDYIRDIEGLDSTVVIMILKDKSEIQISHSANGFSEADYKSFVQMANVFLKEAQTKS